MKRSDNFVPNELQKALFREVMNASLAGSGDALSDDAKAVRAWLEGVKPKLVLFSRVARATLGADSNRTRNEMILGLIAGIDELDAETFRWLVKWNCLRNIASPDAIRAAPDDETLRKNFQALATIDAGL